MEQHRVEVLRPGQTPEFEFWSNPDGTVYLCRQKEEDHWQAIVDGDVVVDTTNPWTNAHLTRAVKPLTAPGVSGLVPLLAMQEKIHVIMDLDPIAASSRDGLGQEIPSE